MPCCCLTLTITATSSLITTGYTINSSPYNSPGQTLLRHDNRPRIASGCLTRSTDNPILANGPDAYDGVKVGPRVVLILGQEDYRMWSEAVPDANRASVGYATSSDGLHWVKQGEVFHPSEEWEGGANGEISPNSILVEDGVYKLWYHS